MSNRALLIATVLALLVAGGLFVWSSSSAGWPCAGSCPVTDTALPLQIDIPPPPTPVVVPDTTPDQTTILRDRKIQPLRKIAKAAVAPVRAARESRATAEEQQRQPVRTLMRAPARLLGRILRR